MDRYVPPFTITEEMLELTAEISEALGKLSSVSDLERLPRLRRVNRIRSIQSSLAIENNTLSLEQLAEWGMERACLSFELRHEQIRDLGKVLPCEAIVYGRLPLMITENCLIANAHGCKSRDLAGPCRRCHSLTDRRGEVFPLCRQFGCRTEIENARVLYLADKPEWRRCGLRFARLRFTTESPEQCAAVLAQYRSGGGAPPEGFTRGLFYRGVE